MSFMNQPNIASSSTSLPEKGNADKICQQCGRSFQKAAHLLRHARIHADERPFACSSCGTAFARTDALQRHERTVHSIKRHRTNESSTGESLDEPNGYTDGLSRDMAQGSNSFYADYTVQGLYGQSEDLPPTVSGSSSHPQNRTLNPASYMPSLVTLSPNMPMAPFLGTVPPPMPSTEIDLDDLIGDWFNHDGGASAAESALAFVFSDQPQSEPVSNGYTNHAIPQPPAFAVQDQPPYNSRAPILQIDIDNPHDAEPPPKAAQWENLPDINTRSLAFEPSENALPPSSVNSTTLSGTTPQTALTADTWESGILQPRVFRPAARNRPLPSRITSPEQVVGELHVDGEEAPVDKASDSVIPSMKFLDSCLHLYFRDFHPSFPIIHRPTFQRDRTSPLLLLSMCSIGCMFVGTQAARERGLWIYERLHYVIVFTRDSKMATEVTRIAVTLSALLGQCFSFLYGQPKQMLTAESCHGILCTMARRSGLLKMMKRNPISWAEVRDLDVLSLEQRWRDWGNREMLRRVTLGLTIHAAESTAYSGLPRLVPAQVTGHDSFQDSIFEADDATSWREQLKMIGHECSGRPDSTGESSRNSDAPEVFLPTVLMAQRIVNIHMLREIGKTTTEASSLQQDLIGFYEEMMTLAKRHQILSPSSSDQDKSPRPQSLSVLWHYTCAVRLSPIDLIEEAAGRGGSPLSESVAEIRAWVGTPAARLATLHCGHILYLASDLKDLAFLLPRAVFQATLLLFCYISFMPPPSDSAETIDATRATEWRRLAELCDLAGQSKSNSRDGRQLMIETINTPAEQYIAYGQRSVRVKGFVDGREPQLDIVGLRSTSNRLLRRCTPWGIGDTLGDILSTISF